MDRIAELTQSGCGAFAHAGGIDMNRIGPKLVRERRNLVGQLYGIGPGKLVLAIRSRVETFPDRGHTDIGAVTRSDIDANDDRVGGAPRHHAAPPQPRPHRPGSIVSRWLA